ncbi:MAG: hypothetical protein MUC35_07030 [Candidatus Margulisbacteria bacterium]|jgi:hypothetical protein|nr:hypothetical protein [Candidatus Margulisiibacteriota bacterium]
MTDPIDGLSNLTQISANIEVLKQAQLNSTAAAKQSGGTATDVDSYLIQTEQNFSKMLDVLTTVKSDDTGGSSNSDPLAYFSSEQSSTLSDLTAQQNALQLQKLAAAEQSSALLGRTVTYYTTDSLEQQSGVVSKITFNDGGAPFLLLEDGKTIQVGAVNSVK